MGSFSILIFLVTIVWGVLNIILFFKIWGMVDDVRELKEYFLKQAPHKNLEENKHTEEKNVKPSLTPVQVNWKHKFNIGDIVIYKESGKELRIAQVLEKEYQYKCELPETGELLSAIFEEKEFY